MIGTLVPLPTIVLTLPGIIVGPSLGYFYGGMPGRAWTGIGLRVVGVGGVVSSFVICGWDCGPKDSSYDIAWAVFLAGAGLTVGSAIYDLADIKPAVRKRNEKLKSGPEISISPTYFADAGASGFRLTIRF
jgi:hypothetical protein